MSMRSPQKLALHLAAWGTAECDLAALAPLRKALPKWAPEGMPGHFLKHADEQTVVAVAALDRAIESLGAPRKTYANWMIVASPQCIGRIAGASSLDRFAKSGAPTVSPHLIPQHSLHSVSGALSILLASHQPNFGAGGGDESLTEGLLAALTAPGSTCDGVWFVASGWDPEPMLDDLGNCTNTPRCFASVLALMRAASGLSRGELQLVQHATESGQSTPCRSAGPAELCQLLARGNARIAWPLHAGGQIVLEAGQQRTVLAAAA